MTDSVSYRHFTGAGVIAREAAAAVGPTGSVTGIDLAPDMIEHARSTPAPGGATIEWQQGDAAAREMRRVITEGGRLVVNTPGRDRRVLPGRGHE